MGKRKVSLKGILQIIEDANEVFFPLVRRQIRKDEYQRVCVCQDLYPSEIISKGLILERKGWVEIDKKAEGWMIKLSRKGKKEIQRYKLADIRPKKQKWDGKWRLLFFDIAETDKKKRDTLRYYLKRTGMIQMQKSVWVGPYDMTAEIKFIKEVLEVPAGVKWAVAGEIENNTELRRYFRV
jgi:DNA-binding transcriptional regulator PaaX